MEAPISKAQHAIYAELDAQRKAAQSRIDLFLMTVLAGASITTAQVTEVTETAIVYSVPEAPE